MTIIGTREEIQNIHNECNGRCMVIEMVGETSVLNEVNKN